MNFKSFLKMLAPVLLVACSSSQSDGLTSPSDGPTSPLRPGLQDSSKVYKGNPSTSETAFWNAVRDGDDDALQDGIAMMKSDVQKDPTNGYSAFLIGAGSFMPSSKLVLALAGNQPISPEGGAFSDDAAAFFNQGLEHLTDPLYVGFDYTFLASFPDQTSAAAAKLWELAVANNVAASSLGIINRQLSVDDTPGALDTLLKLFKYCNDGELDVDAPDLQGFVDAANQGGLIHRECYSGYHAMHGTEGALLLAGDLFAVNGKPELAVKSYEAMARATNYPSWPLRPLAERRIDGTQPAKAADLPLIVACPTCHVNEIQ